MRHIFDYIKRNKLLLWLIVPAFLFHMIVIFPSGSPYCFNDKCGLFFWGAHGHDALWHLAVAEVAFSKIPPVMPIFSGTLLTGYNYLFDLLLFLFTLLRIPAFIGYFKILPIIWFVLFTTLSIKLALKIKNSPLFIGLLLFFFYFGGSLGFLLTLFHQKTIWGSESLLAMQSGHTLINPPFAFSLLTLLAILSIILDNKLTLKTHFKLGCLMFATLGFKFYGGVIASIIIGLYYLSTILWKKNIVESIRGLVIILLFSLLALFIFYNPTTSIQSGAVFKFDFFATVHPFIEEPNLFYLKDKVLQRYYLQEHGIGPRLIYIELLTLSLFLAFNFGTRVLGIFYLAHRVVKKTLNRFEVIASIAIITGIILATTLVQKGEWWNSIQFIYYSIFLSNIFVALLLYNILERKNAISYILVAIVLILTIPINLDLVKSFASFPAPAYLLQEEYEALSFLKKQSAGIVLASPFDKSVKSSYDSPFPLYVYDDTAYVPAFSKKQAYFANTTQLTITGIDYKRRLEKLKKRDCDILSEIDYVYEVPKNSFLKDFKNCPTKFKLIFQKKQVAVYSKTK